MKHNKCKKHLRAYIQTYTKLLQENNLASTSTLDIYFLYVLFYGKRNTTGMHHFTIMRLHNWLLKTRGTSHRGWGLARLHYIQPKEFKIREENNSIIKIQKLERWPSTHGRRLTTIYLQLRRLWCLWLCTEAHTLSHSREHQCIINIFWNYKIQGRPLQVVYTVSNF